MTMLGEHRTYTKVLCLSILVCLFAIGCKRQTDSTSERTANEQAPQVTAGEPSASDIFGREASIVFEMKSTDLPSEGWVAVKGEFLKHFTKGDHDWYARWKTPGDGFWNPESGITCVRKFNMKVEMLDLSEADHLNGIAWNGRIYINSPASRDYEQSDGSPHWEEWRETDVGQVLLTKKGGTWDVRWVSIRRTYKTLSPNEIPKD